VTDHTTRTATFASGTTRRLRSHLQRLIRFALALLVALTAFPQMPAASASEAIAPAAPVATMASGLPLGAAVLDYAGGYSSAAPMRLRRAGVGIVVRYVGGSAWKSLTRSEANALRKAGIDIISVYEPKSAGWMLGGYKAGVAAAKKAHAATVKCGGPRGALIYFACDVDTHDYAAVNACLRGAASVLGKQRVGIYGSYYVCNSALKGGYAAKAWQTIAWSNGKVLPRAAFYQTAPKVHGNLGLGYDSNFARTEDIGQWAFKPGSLTWAAPSALTTAGLGALDFVNSSTGLAVGEDGTTVGTTDGGRTWTLRSAPSTATLRAVDLADTAEGWAVGDAGTVIHTADGGSTWVAQSAPTTASLRAVAFADRSSGWAVGDGGAAIHTVDGGVTWALQSTPATGALNAVDSVDASTGVAVGANGLVIRTIDAGSTWTTASAPTRTILNAVDMVDGANGWAVGGAGIVLNTTNGGVKWTKQSTPTHARLTSVHFLDSATGWAAGDAGTVLRTTNAGATWTLQSTPTTAAVGGVRLTDSTTGWVVGGAGTILRATVVGRSPFGSVEGRVTDVVTGAPVSGAKVYIGGRPTAPSAVDGSFVAARLVPGTYSVRFTNPLYITRSGFGVTFGPGLRAFTTMQLNPRARTSLTKPSLDTTMPLPGQLVSITVTMSPSSAATAAVTYVRGSHYERKTVTKRVKGKKKRVKVWYWKRVFSVRMTPQELGVLVAQRRLSAGKWRLWATFSGSGRYLPSTSKLLSLTVK
jgi:photosystem II stability/assembly factor-like uncharacterized protein